MKKFIKNKCGIAAIELAVVLPCFLMIVFGIIEFGFIYHVQTRLQSSIQDAARYAITNNTYADLNPDALPRKDFVRKVVEKKMGGWIMAGTKVIITTTNVSSASNLSSTDLSLLTPDDINLGKGGDFVIYKIDYSWKTLTPLVQLMAYFGFNTAGNPQFASGTMDLSAVIAAPNEQYDSSGL